MNRKWSALNLTVTDRRAAVGKLALCFALPVALAWGFYAVEQRAVQRPAVLDPAMPAAAATLQYRIEDNRALDRKYYRVAGWIFDPANDIDWLRPSVLVVAPDGKAVEFRANIRRVEDLPQPAAGEKHKGIAGFEVRMKRRYLPQGQPLKLYLVIQREGRRELVDTATVLQAGRT